MSNRKSYKSKNTTITTRKVKKLSKKVKRADYQLAIQPVKFINPFRKYVLPGEVIVSESEGVIYSKLSSVGQYKLIRGFEYEESCQTFRYYLDDSPIMNSFPWKYLTNRLSSFGNIEAKEWADGLTNYCSNVDYIIQNFDKIQNATEEQKGLCKLQEFLYKKNYDPNTPNTIPQGYILKKISKNSIILTELGFNLQFARIFGYDLDFLRSLALKNAIPEFFSKINRALNLKKQLKQPGPDEIYTAHLITKNGSLKKMSFNNLIYTTIRNSHVNQKLIMVVDPKSIEDSTLKTYEQPYPGFEYNNTKKIQPSSDEESSECSLSIG